MKERSIKRRRSNYQAPNARGHANNTSDKPLQNTGPKGAAPIGVDMKGSHSVLSMPVSMPALQNNNFTSLLDRSVARSGLSYDGFVRHITKGALGSLNIWSESDLERLLLTCERLGLDPLGREVYCTEAQDVAADVSAQKKPPLVVVALDGWCRIINSHPQFDGMSFKESAEREDGLLVWIECSMHRKDRRVATTVREYMCENRADQSAWLTHPRRMLRHKALVQCARLCFGLSGIYDPDEAQRIRASQTPIKENPSANTRSDTSAKPEGTSGRSRNGAEVAAQGVKNTFSKPKGTEGIKQWIGKNCAV
jgi:phage recombination protein Bet